ncbi:MAG: CCA tRNA nucleotidyltransferase [Deltaproteobacteria bacterium]|nr:CCA tRNA nucleotidyltransferase [Deltaproteobacteria bacterium]
MDDIVAQVDRIISPVYLVGGCVRDSLMGIDPKDYDFMTPHNPDIIEHKIRQMNRKPFLTGKRFGTIGMKISGHLVEITTFRTERYRDGSRKPDVEFVNDIKSDLGRRDFTINAIAKKGEEIIDPFNGREDIEKKIIKCVGDPALRFKEDPLRMLRAARFSAQLGFTIDRVTFESAARLCYTILNVSKERWVAELDNLLVAPAVDRGLNDLMDMGLFRYMIPELSLQKNYDQDSIHGDGDLWQHTVHVTSSTPRDINVRWAALLHNVARPFVRVEKDGKKIYMKHDSLSYEMAVRLGKYLRWSNKRVETVSNLVKEQLQNDSPLKNSRQTSN